MESLQSFYAVFQPIWTIIVMVFFLSIAAWAWSSKNKTSFDEAAHLPFDDDDELVPTQNKISVKEK
jgi:cytochrome c oxidase cbb3-type subunit 4